MLITNYYAYVNVAYRVGTWRRGKPWLGLLHRYVYKQRPDFKEVKVLIEHYYKIHIEVGFALKTPVKVAMRC